MPSTSEFTAADRARRPPAIEVDDVSASYQVRIDQRSLKGTVRGMVRRDESSVRVVPALQGITLDVPQGTVLGVIGRNGAGKSTLLRTMAGILAPSSGKVTVRGRISALLSVGVGMSEALTGRENIRLGGLAVGIPEDRLDELADDIAEFAQLGEYVDFPVRTYSSGMRSRLGFSVAAHLDPEILLIDEALTGGDAKFKEKTADKMFDLCGDGRTIVLVSHGLSLVRVIATKVAWMHQGKIVEYGDPDDVVASYMRYSRLEASSADWED